MKLSIGGYNDKTKISLSNVDTRIDVHNSLEVGTYVKDDYITIVNGRYREKVNDKEIERKLIFKFDNVEEDKKQT